MALFLEFRCHFSSQSIS